MLKGARTNRPLLQCFVYNRVDAQYINTQSPILKTQALD